MKYYGLCTVIPRNILKFSQQTFFQVIFSLVIHNIQAVCALLILDRVTGFRQGHCCPIRVAAGCSVLTTHLPAPCWPHHLSSDYTLTLFLTACLFSKHPHMVLHDRQDYPTLSLSVKWKAVLALHTSLTCRDGASHKMLIRDTAETAVAELISVWINMNRNLVA